ncbi:MAG: cysteine--tRNA ligase [Candidatus Kapabacteria bacterium]|nr:cysteine--tRNA ligase [Ignavibacteria bacterium]MBP6510134.1 cysteine--tRNA ligase [Candidatus Kapabacteria bacterium]
MNIRLFNTLTKRIDAFSPLDPTRVRMYSCGPTVYDVAHIGNMRAFLLPDLLQRTLRVVGGFDVSWVMNITDIDDKTIRDSAVGSEKWRPEMGTQTTDALANLKMLTAFYAEEFHRDLASFNIVKDHFAAQPLATDYIPQMQALINDILAAGYAYASDGSVYFNVAAYAKDHAYGRLFAIDTEHFREGVRIDADEYDRESVSDFVLWKARKEGEPYWDYDVNGTNLPGRPGWHIECSAMSKDILGLPFDIHTGGVDLRFPHHEDELAQCTAGYHEHDQATFWVHNEFLEVEGKKMSKSLGNFYTMRDLVAKGIDPLDVRFAMLQAHYRTVYNFTFDGVKGASAARTKIQDYIYDVKERSTASSGSSALASELRTSVFTELADDLHTPKALAALFSFIGQHAASSLTPDEASSVLGVLAEINDVLAVFEIADRPVIVIPDDVASIAEQRWTARSAKDWAESDRLRAQLTALGWTMNDGKDSYTLEPMA